MTKTASAAVGGVSFGPLGRLETTLSYVSRKLDLAPVSQLECGRR